MGANVFFKELTPSGKGGKNGNDRVASPDIVSIHFNPFFTGGLLHCYMVVKSICHFKGVRSTLSPLFYF